MKRKKNTPRKTQSSKAMARAGRKTESFEELARAAVARIAVIPSVTDILETNEARAMIEAYIDQHCADDSKEELRAKAKVDAGRDDTSADIVWIKEEIAFALGVEVGRRLVAGAPL